METSSIVAETELDAEDSGIIGPGFITMDSKDTVGTEYLETVAAKSVTPADRDHVNEATPIQHRAPAHETLVVDYHTKIQPAGAVEERQLIPTLTHTIASDKFIEEGDKDMPSSTASYRDLVSVSERIRLL